MKKRIFKIMLAVFCIVPVALGLVACGGGGNNGKLSNDEWEQRRSAVSSENIGSYTLTLGNVGSQEEDNTYWEADFENGVAYTKRITVEDGVATTIEQYSIKRDDKIYWCQKVSSGSNTWNAFSYPINSDDYGDYRDKNQFKNNTGNPYCLDYIQSCMSDYQFFTYDSKTQIYTKDNGSRIKLTEDTLTYWQGEDQTPYILSRCGQTTISIPDAVETAISNAFAYGE